MAQVTVMKNNKVLNIEDTRLESYLLQGYDQIDKDGNVVKKATGGRTVSLQEHNKLSEELNELKQSHADSLEEVEELKKENATLKGKITKLEKAASKEENK
ncbi:hypothetical protein ACWE42_16230 [Sutcliffiella cohnii]